MERELVMATIEFYCGEGPRSLVTSLEDGAVPHRGEYISIKKATYQVRRVTWAVDAADEPHQCRKLRANVEMEKQ